MVRVFRAMHKQGGSKGSTITEDDGDGKGCAALQQPANVTAKQINVDDDKVRPFVRATDRAISKQTREAFNIGLEVCSMFFPLVAMVRVDLSNPNTLTPEEAAEIQSITDKYNTNIDVVVSRAASRGCNVATDLPVGKGSDKRSDIDFRYDASHPQAESIRTDLQGLGGGRTRAPDIARRIERRNRLCLLQVKKMIINYATYRYIA